MSDYKGMGFRAGNPQQRGLRKLLEWWKFSTSWFWWRSHDCRVKSIKLYTEWLLICKLCLKETKKAKYSTTTWVGPAWKTAFLPVTFHSSDLLQTPAISEGASKYISERGECPWGSEETSQKLVTPWESKRPSGWGNPPWAKMVCMWERCVHLWMCERKRWGGIYVLELQWASENRKKRDRVT